MNVKKHIWSITPEGLQQVEQYFSLSLVEKLKGVAPIEAQPLKAAAYYDKPGKGRKGGKEGMVRVIPIDGVMVKKKSFEMMILEYFFGIKMNTTRDIIEAMNQAEKDDSVKGVVLSADTPGGTVDGIEALSARIKSFTKPVVGFIDGMACSAGYYALSQSDEIMAEESDSMVGSIGTAISFFNQAGWMNQMGIQLVRIVADSSPDKQQFPNAYEEPTPEQIEAAKAILNPANERFISAVKSGRPKVKPEHLTGKVFNAAETVGSLVDSIGTLQNAVDRVVYLSNKFSNQKSNKMEQSEASVLREVMQAQIDDLKSQLTAKEEAAKVAQTEASDLSQKVAALEADKATLTAQLAEKETTITDLNQKLEETPADTVTAVNEKHEMLASESNPHPWMNAPWNKEAARQMAELSRPEAKK